MIDDLEITKAVGFYISFYSSTQHRRFVRRVEGT